MKIPFHKPYITEDEISAAADMMRDGWLTAGIRTVAFENAFRNYVGCGNAVSVNSATAGLHLSLAAIGLREDDEVLVPAMTFTATAEVVRYFNAWPVLVDIERGHPPDGREKNRGKDHRAHQGRHADAFRRSALRHGRDNAISRKSTALPSSRTRRTAFPSWYRGRQVGALGDMTCFSFYATKTITTGEGGMVCTDNDEWAKRMRVLRLHGIDRDAWERLNSPRFWQYDVVEAGYKYNTTDIASAIGIVQLKKVEMIWEMRKRIAERYTAAFGGRDEPDPVHGEAGPRVRRGTCTRSTSISTRCRSPVTALSKRCMTGEWE